MFDEEGNLDAHTLELKLLLEGIRNFQSENINNYNLDSDMYGLKGFGRDIHFICVYRVDEVKWLAFWKLWTIFKGNARYKNHLHNVEDKYVQMVTFLQESSCILYDKGA